MANPPNGKVVLETFWWNRWNANYPADWYTYLAKLAPRLATMGFDGIWTPPSCKDTSAIANIGYTPFNYYDLGQKDQKGAVGTRFGTIGLVFAAGGGGTCEWSGGVSGYCSGPLCRRRAGSFLALQSRQPAQLYLKMQYMGPSESTLF